MALAVKTPEPEKRPEKQTEETLPRDVVERPTVFASMIFPSLVMMIILFPMRRLSNRSSYGTCIFFQSFL